MSEISTKPYLLRAIYVWCTDNGYTPYLAARVDAHTRVPMQFVKNNEIVLNISFEATSGLEMDNQFVNFSARFGGVSRDISVPVDNVIAIYARENGQGMAFEATVPAESDSDAAVEQDLHVAPPSPVAPILTSVPSPTSDTKPGSSDTDPEKDLEPPKKGGGIPTLTRIK